jgi:hypothetical protein
MAKLELHIVVKSTPAILQEVEGHIREYIEDLCALPLVSAEYEIAGGLVVEKEGCDGEEKSEGLSNGK